MLGLDAEVAKLQAKVGSKSKSVKRRRQKQTAPSIFELSKVKRSGSSEALEAPSAARRKLEAKAALYEKLSSSAAASAAGAAEEDVMVDFMAKHTDRLQDRQPGSSTAPAAAGPVASGEGDVVVTDEFGRRRTVPAGSAHHKEARRKQREANALSTKIAQRQARVMGHDDGRNGHGDAPTYG